MSPNWTAEVVVDAPLAAQLIATQFPELAPRRVEPFGEGFDNTAYLVDGEWVFRFPRRQIAVPTLQAELLGLPLIAGRLPLATPAPAFVGAPGDAYGWPFLGYRLLPGRPACRARLDDTQRTALAEPLARFLRALHDQPCETLDTDPCRRTESDILLPRARTAFATLGDAPRYLALVDRIPADWTPAADTFVHGDFYACHLLVDDSGQPTGVIDWGDVHRGDPAVDLAIVYGALPPPARQAFWTIYGAVSDARRRVAQLRAAYHATLLLAYARDLGDEALVADTLDTLRRSAED